MPYNKIVAFWVEENWEAPRVLEGDKVRFLGVVVEMYGSECSNLFACHLRAVYALFQRRRQQRCPYEEETAVPSHVEFGHDAVNDVWLRGENVDGVHVPLCLASLLQALNVRDVRVEDVIFLDNIVYELFGFFVDDEYLPLRAVLVLAGLGIGYAHVATGHLADGIEDHCITYQYAPERERAQYTGPYALAGSQSWTPSWRGTAASAGRMQRSVGAFKSSTVADWC